MKCKDEFRKATMSFSLASLGHIFCFSVLFLLIIFSGCTFETQPLPLGPRPEVKSFDFHPMYFCSGDKITATWDTKDIDKIELKTNNGELILSTVWPSGTLTTPPIDKSMLPLKVRGYAGDDWKEYEVDNLVNIDNPTWTENIPSTIEIPIPESLRRVHVYNDEVTLADGTTQTVPVYELHMKYKGFHWQKGANGSIPGFSHRAWLDKIINSTGPMLRFKSYVSGSVTMGAGAEGDINPNWPGQIASFQGYYHPGPVEHFIGWQHGDIKKPPDDWFYIEQFYQEATAQVQLLVFCDQQ